MRSRKILITGANGYFGSSLIFYLIEKGYQPVALLRKGAKWEFPLDVETRTGEILDEGFLAEAITDMDIIFHVAGLKGYDQCLKYVDKIVEANILFTDRLLKATRGKKVKIIFTSTYWVYGHKSPLPYHENLPLMPTEPYGWSKALAERLVMASGINYTVVRLTNVFGYGMGKGYDEVTSLFLKRAFAGDYILLNNAGEQSIDLIYIDDVCKALLSIIELKMEDIILNIGSGMPISILKLAEAVNEVSRRLTGNEAEIRKCEKESNEILFSDRWVDISRLEKLTGFTPTPLVIALERFAHKLLSQGVS